MTMIINIPFTGFYGSWYSDDLNRAEEDCLDYYCEENYVSDEVKDQLADRVYQFCDYKAMKLEICKDYVAAFDDYISRNFDLQLGLTFSDMSSPREYNFTTDRIFCHVSEEKAALLCSYVGQERLAAAIKRNFTSRDGFISFYSNDLDDWLEKPLLEWDHNELGTLLVALLAEDKDYDMWCYESTMEDSSAFDKGFDYAKFEQKVKELQLEESGESEADGRVFPLGITDTETYVKTYISMNGLKP